MSNTARYFDLSTPAPKRLQMMREAFANHAAKYPHCPEWAKPKTWRDIRGTTHKGVHAYTGGLSQGLNDGNPVYYTHTGPQFRNERFADEIDNSQDRGWYTDTDRNELARGIVGRLTHGRCIAGYHWSSNGERVYFPEVFTDTDDAAQAANEHARVFAEAAFEDSERFDAARELEEENETALQRLRECLVLRHKACMRYVRDEISELIDGIREKRETLRTDYADFA